MNLFGQVLNSNRGAGPILLDTLKQLEPILKQSNPARLAEIYKQTWSAMPQPQTSGYVRTTPYYLIGERYVALLQQMGQDAEAQRVQARLDAINRPPPKSNRGY